MKSLLHLTILFSLAVSAPTAIASGEFQTGVGGHLKTQLSALYFPSDSRFRDLLGSRAVDGSAETRLKFRASKRRWDFQADYQFIGIYADSLQLAAALPGAPLPLNGVINDDRRWWNLTTSFGDDRRTAIINRLDRLNVGYTSDRAVLRFGRQAISWGNGLLFNPVDVFNPFDPAAVDKEYKTGDDMLYGQYLFASGNDLQAVAVIRRDPRSGNVEQDQSSLAVKYHGFLGSNEVDLLAAEHFGDQILGLGGNIGLGGAVWRGDLTWTRTDRDESWSAVTSLSYSWTWGGKNVSGLVEYYYNGFGQRAGHYDAEDLAANPDLLRRLERGELFNLARHYLAASVTVELSPLLRFVPNLFLNVGDPSALAQFVVQYDWRQDLLFLGAVNLPLGDSGTEYGGIPALEEGRYFSTGPGAFAQLAWYF